MRHLVCRGVAIWIALSLAASPTPAFSLRGGMEGGMEKELTDVLVPGAPTGVGARHLGPATTGLEEPDVPLALRQLFAQARTLRADNAIVLVPPYELSIDQPPGPAGLHLTVYKTEGPPAGDSGQTQEIIRVPFTPEEQAAVLRCRFRVHYRLGDSSAVTLWKSLEPSANVLEVRFTDSDHDLGLQTLIRVEVELPPTSARRLFAPPPGEWYTMPQLLGDPALAGPIVRMLPPAWREPGQPGTEWSTRFQEVGVFRGSGPPVLHLYVPMFVADAQALWEALEANLAPRLRELDVAVQLDPLPFAAKVEFPGVVFGITGMTTGRTDQSLGGMATIYVDPQRVVKEIETLSPEAVTAVAFHPALVGFLRHLKAQVVTIQDSNEWVTTIWV